MYSIEQQYDKCQMLFNAPGMTITQGQLRAETQLLQNNQITWNLQQTNGQTPTASEVLLKPNDAFFITDWGFALKQIASDTPTANQHVNAILYYYNNPTVFAGANATNVGALYNALFNITIDNTVYNTTFPMMRFQRVPIAQQGEVQAAIAGPVTYTIARDAISSALEGFFPNYPFLAFNGTQNIIPSIQLPKGTNLNFDDASNSIYAVLLVNGFYIQQGANLELNTENRFVY